MCGVLILVVLFRFATIYPDCIYKSHFSWDFRCPAKEAVILLLSWNNLYVATSKCILSWFYFDFRRFTKNQRCMYKGHSFLKFFMLCERTSEITSFVEQPVYSNFQMFSVLTLVFLFSFTTIHAKYFCRSYLFLKFEVLGTRSSDIATSMEHLVYISLKMYSVLILLYLFCFATFDP